MYDARSDLRDLRKDLANFYPNVADARRVVSDAGLSIGRINFDGPPIVFWQNILDEAQKTGAIDELVRIASSDYPALQAFSREAVVPRRPDEDRTLALAFHVARPQGGSDVEMRHLLAALSRSPDPLVNAAWPSSVDIEHLYGETRLLDGRELERLTESPPDVPIDLVERRSDESVKRVILHARSVAALRGTAEVCARDLLIASLTFSDKPAVQALFDGGILGETVWLSGRARVTVVHTTSPWRLPLAAMTLPTRPGSEPDGGLFDAMSDSLSEETRMRFRAEIRRVNRETPVEVHKPVWVTASAPESDWEAFPLRVVLSTASTAQEAGFAAIAICHSAAIQSLPSLGVAMLGSGRGGLDSVAVARAMFHAVRDAAERGETPPLVVLTTSKKEVVEVLRGEAAGPPHVMPPPSVSISATIDVGSPPSSEEPPASPSRPAPLWLTMRDGTCKLARPGSKEIWARLFTTPWANSPLSAQGDAQELAANWSLQEVTSYGDSLATALFDGSAPPEVLDALKIPSSGPAQRIVLDLDGDAARVPWEYLRVGGAFLLDRNVSLVRHVDTVVAAPRPLSLGATPAKVLVAVAAPDDRPHFEAMHDLTKVADALQSIGTTVHQAGVCTRGKLDAMLAEVAKDLGAFHFLGHGEVDVGGHPVLLVHDESDSKVHADIAGDELARWLLRTNARFVFLGACHSGEGGKDEFSGVAHAIVHLTGIPVVAMQLAVPQDFSTAFAASFYKLLQSEGWNLEAAVARARAVPHDGRHAFGIPVLFADMKNPPELVTIPPPPKAWEFASINVLLKPRDVAEALAKVMPHVATQTVIEKISASTAPLPAAPFADDDAPTTARKVRALAKAAKLTDDERDALLAPLEARRTASASVALTNEARPIQPIDERPIPREWSRWQTALDTLGAKYCLPGSLLRRVVAELLAGRHVLLVGPVGTGKTSLAIDLCDALGYTPLTATASADWSASDIVGGFWPRTDKDGKTTFAFRPGVFTEAVFANWSPGPTHEGKVLWSRRPVGGRWLVLDELNRADMDRAMGALFTAMETRRLRVSLQGDDTVGTTEVPIPQDFRVIATMNTADRHYLFKLSEALRRRFAFIEVPDALDFANEQTVVDARIEKTYGVAHADDDALHDLAWRFVRLARSAHPVGTASVIAAKTFLHASRGSGMSPAERVSQALLGSVVPILEDAGRDVVELLLEWATSRDVAQLTLKLEALRAPRLEVVSEALAGLGSAATGSPAQHVAATLVRPSALPELDALPELAQRLRAIVRETA